MTYRQEDMPWTHLGVTPDIVVNPVRLSSHTFHSYTVGLLTPAPLVQHAIPSRMTIGQLVECLTGKVASLSGNEGDGTAFNTKITVDDVAKQLHKLGFQRHGNETMMSGFTGRQLTARIFIGPTFYQRLKHMVDDKIHSRARGPVRFVFQLSLPLLVVKMHILGGALI